MDDLDVLDRDAEAVRDELGERRLVALAVAMGAGEHRHRTGRVEADLARLVESGAGAQRSSDVAGSDAAGLDVAGEADAAQLAACLGLRLAGGEALIVDQGQRLIQVLLEQPAVVLERHRRVIGHGRGRNEVAPPQLRLVDPKLARRVLDDRSIR